MAIAYVGGAVHDSPLSSSCSIPYTSTNGNMLIAMSSVLVNTFSDTAGNTYTLWNNGNLFAGPGFYCYYCFGAAAITSLTFNTSTFPTSGIIGEYSGVYSVGSSLLTTTASPGGGAASPILSQSLSAGQWLIGFCANSSSNVTNTVTNNSGNQRQKDITLGTGQTGINIQGVGCLYDNTGAWTMTIGYNGTNINIWRCVALVFNPFPAAPAATNYRMPVFFMGSKSG
jgi:hypothetical protein